MTNTKTTTTYDKYNFIVAYVSQGRLEIEETNLLREVKRRTHIGTSLDEVCDELRERYVEDTGGDDSGGHGFLFEYIYKGCERIVEEVA